MGFDGNWIPGAAIAVAGAGISWWRASYTAIAVVKVQIEELESRNKGMTEDLKIAAKELRQVVTDIRVMSAEQAVVNKMSLATLESLVRKVEDHDRKLAEHSASISLIRELTEGGR